MAANPFLGVFFHWLGGLASGSFYVPYRGVKKWAWETYWLVGGFFSWIIVPALMAFLLAKAVSPALSEASGTTIFWTYFWGAMWGLGGLTFGLTMRYLGMSLGMAVALSYCSAFGTLMPPLFEGTLVDKFSTPSGLYVLAGIIVCLAGIAVTGMAGMSKDKEMPEEQKKKVIKEFNFWKGILVATFSGVMSASFSYGLAAGDPIKELTLKYNFIQSGTAEGLKVQNPAPLPEAQVQELWNQIQQVKTPAVAEMVKKLSGKMKTPRLDPVVAYIDQDKDANNAAVVRTAVLALPGPASAKISEYYRNLNAITCADPNAAEDLKKSVKGFASFDLKETAMQVAMVKGDTLVTYIGKHTLWQGLPVLVVVLLGGFTTNFIWCVLLNIKNKTGREYFSSTVTTVPARESETIIETALDAPSEEVVERMPKPKKDSNKVPLFGNYFFSALAGTTWYLQFFFYSMGETQMGEFKFSSWTLHMASIIIFSTLWGIALKEWKGSSKKTHTLIAIGLFVLILSTVIVGYGNYLDSLPKAAQAVQASAGH